MAEKFGFTKAKLAAVPTPAKGRTFVYDAKTPGLVLSVTAKGHRSYMLYRKVDGRPLKRKLGDFDAISIEQARKLTLKDLATIADGKRPESRQRSTFGEVRDDYLANYAKGRLSPRTLRSEESLWKSSLDGYAGRKLSQTKAKDLRDLHAALGESAGHRTANRAIQYLRRMYRYARKHHGYKGEMPTDLVDLFVEQSRERFLKADELPRFLKAADAEVEPFADFFRILLFTGARLGNVRAMRWDHMNLKAGQWTIPASEAKGGKDIVVPLVPDVLDILKRRSEQGGDYVFPVQRDKGKHPYIGEPQRPFHRICERAGITGLRIHDLRRTMGSWQAIGGTSQAVIGASLGHRDLRATAVYTRASDEAVRTSMTAAVAAMNAAESAGALHCGHER